MCICILSVYVIISANNVVFLVIFLQKLTDFVCILIIAHLGHLSEIWDREL